MIKLFRFIFLSITFCIINLFVYQNNSYADAWVQEKGKGLIIARAYLQSFRTMEFWQYTNKRVQQIQYQFYGAYGLTKRITMIVNAIAVENFLNKHNNYFSSNKQHSFGLDTLELSARTMVFKSNNFVASIVVGGITPSIYNKNKINFFAPHKWSYKGGFELGCNFNEYADFITFSAYYIDYIDHWYDQIQLNLTWGHYFSNGLLMMLSLQKYFYIITGRDPSNSAYWYYVANNSSYWDFIAKSGFAKINLAFVIPITTNFKIEFGAYSSIKSRLLLTQKLGLQLYGIYAGFWYNFE